MPQPRSRRHPLHRTPTAPPTNRPSTHAHTPSVDVDVDVDEDEDVSCTAPAIRLCYVAFMLPVLCSVLCMIFLFLFLFLLFVFVFVIFSIVSVYRLPPPPPPPPPHPASPLLVPAYPRLSPCPCPCPNSNPTPDGFPSFGRPPIRLSYLVYRTLLPYLLRLPLSLFPCLSLSLCSYLLPITCHLPPACYAHCTLHNLCFAVVVVLLLRFSMRKARARVEGQGGYAVEDQRRSI